MRRYHFLIPLLLFISSLWGVQNIAQLTQWSTATFGLNALPYLSQFLETLLWFSAAWILGKLINSLFINPLIRRRTGNNAPKILANMVFAVLFLVTTFAVIRFVFDRPISGLVATSGLVSVIIGFAIRDMIADFFSGLAMNIERPYQIGDWLELGPNLIGRVTELNWRATRLITLSERTVIVPNNNLASRQFINFSKPDPSFREAMDIVLNFTADPKRMENILLSAVLATKGLVDCDRHQVRIKSFSERGVVYEVRFWIPDYKQRVQLRHGVSKNILTYLNQAGVVIPYQQHDLTVNKARKPRQEARINAKRLLSRVEWLGILNDGELEQLSHVVIEREFSASQDVVRMGDDGSSLYVLVEGIMEVMALDEGNQATVVGIIEPGQAVGEMSLLTGAPRAATVRAKTTVFVLEVRREDFEPILRARPNIADTLGELMVRRANINDLHRHQSRNGDNAADISKRARQLAKRISQFFGL